MNTWFRLYNEAVFDPKVQTLSPSLFKLWINLLCLSSRNDGVVPSLSDISFTLHTSELRVQLALSVLQSKGLIDKTDKGLIPHNWDNRQFKSDGSTERVQRFRAKVRNVSETLHTPLLKQDQTQTQIRPDTDTDQKGKGNAPPALIAHGEFGAVNLTKEQVLKLTERLNGNFQAFIDRLDRYSQTHPKEFRKYKSHYAVILQWYDRDANDGRIKPDSKPTMPAQPRPVY